MSFWRAAIAVVFVFLGSEGMSVISMRADHRKEKAMLDDQTQD